MRFSVAAAAVAAVFATSAAAAGLSWFGDDVIATDDELDVPGESPLKFCDADRDNDIIVINKVDLSPNPPEAGQTLTITANGIVREPIEDGAYVQLQVKYGYIRLVNMKTSLCDQIKNVDLECPIEKGLISIVKDIDLPKEIPPGKYVVHADVYTGDDEHITCLDATVWFGRKDKSIEGDASDL